MNAKTFLAVAALLMSPATSHALKSGTPKAAILTAYEPREFTTTAIPPSATTSALEVLRNGYSADAHYEPGSGRDSCRFKTVQGVGLRGVLVSYHNTCDVRRPSVIVVWIPEPNEVRRRLRVSLLPVWFTEADDVLVPDPAPTPGPTFDDGSPFDPSLLSCVYDPDGGGPAAAFPVAVNFSASRFVAQRKPVTP